MSVGLDDIDLNSPLDDRNGGVHGVNTSESAVGFGRADEGLGYVQSGDNGKLDGMSVEGEIGVNDGSVPNTDSYRGDSMCFEGNSNGVEKNFIAIFEKNVGDRAGESISARDEVGGEAAAEAVIPCGEEGEDRSAGLQPVEVKLNVGVGGEENVGLVCGDADPSMTEVASGSLDRGDKPDQQLGGSSNLVKADGEEEGTEVKDDRCILDHLADDTNPLINGIGSNGNQGVVIEARTEDIRQLQDTDKENVKPTAFKPESQVQSCRSEKAGQFHVSDLVWGKVRSHPWWPGQIFDPSDAAEKARKYCKKDGLLIAYFGDQTFAWNEASRIKPFQMHFPQMGKQSNTESFCYAVHCALEEVSRRVEFGLACSCLSKEVYDKIKTQIVVNAGIRKESCRRDGGDERSSVVSFMPMNVVQYVKALAQSPVGGRDKLEFVIARSQLLAISRWKGFYRLPELEMLGGSLEDGADVPVTGERKYSEGVSEAAIHVPLGDVQLRLRKGKSANQDTFSRKRKEISGDGMSPSKKERCLSDLMSTSPSKLSNGQGEPEGKAGRNLTSSSSAKKRKATDSVPDDLKVKAKEVSLSPVTKKQFSRVGESIRRVANQLAIGEMLSQLYMASRDPMKGDNILPSSVSFFSNFRNSLCLENSTSRQHKSSTGKVSGQQTAKKLSNSDTTETSGLEGLEDSYWTDRIVQNSVEEQVLFEPETPKENGSPTVEPEAALKSGQELDSKQETAFVGCESDRKPESLSDKKCEEEYTPTALILSFTDLESVPSESNLIKIFSRYGPLKESETEVLKKSKRAKVVFKRRSDADTAFSSSGKFSIFGPSLVSYRLTSATKRSKKGSTSVEGNGA